MVRSVARLLLATALLFIPSACSKKGPALYPVHGQVLWDDEPAAGALIVFHPLDQENKSLPKPSATVTDDGTFALATFAENDGAPAGNYAVTIALALSRTESASLGERQRAQRFPLRYADPKTSQLTARVDVAATQVPAFHIPRK